MAVKTILVETTTSKILDWTDCITRYGRETSKTRALDLTGLGTPQQPSSPTLEAVLDMMATASGKVVLIYAHGTPGGLIMRTATNASSAQVSKLAGISRAWKAVDEIIAIRGPTANIPRFKELFGRLTVVLRNLSSKFAYRLDPISHVTSRDKADKWFDKWMELMAKACLAPGLGQNDLRRVCRAMQKVRDKKFDRVEIRACNIGKRTASLNILRDFFGAKKVLAPKVTMFFGKAPLNLNPTGDIESLITRIGGFRGDTFVAPRATGHQLNTVTGGEAAVARGRRNRIFPSTAPADLVMQLTEVAPFRFKGRIWTRNRARLNQFLSDNYKNNHTFNTGTRLPVYGMWTAGAASAKVPFVLPLEARYRSFIVSSS